MYAHNASAVCFSSCACRPHVSSHSPLGMLWNASSSPPKFREKKDWQQSNCSGSQNRLAAPARSLAHQLHRSRGSIPQSTSRNFRAIPDFVLSQISMRGFYCYFWFAFQGRELFCSVYTKWKYSLSTFGEYCEFVFGDKVIVSVSSGILPRS